MTPEEMLSASGISLSDARSLGIIALAGEAVEVLSPNFKRVPGLMFPYYGIEGEDTGFFRVRYLEMARDNQGNEIRYAQPTGSLTGVYLPRVPGLDWAAISVNPGQQIVITEGEKKAACACLRGIPTVGLGGVSSYRSGRFDIELLDPLQRFEWTGRSVVIAFDSDASHKSRVVEAQAHLAQLLIQRGAIPLVVTMPPTDDGDRQGLDDYLVAAESPEDAWEDLLATGQEAQEAVALWRMNSEYAVIQIPGAVVHIPTRHTMLVGEFRSLHAANRTFMKKTTYNNGAVKSSAEQLAPYWLKWEQRRTYQSMVYEPGNEEAVRLPTGAEALNLWRGWGVQPVEGDVQPWLDLLEFVFRSEPQNVDWFEQWCAYPIQNPGAKVFSYVMFWSHVEGVGKTMIPYTLMDIYGREQEGHGGPVNSKEIGNRDLENFNSWQRQKQFIYGDEIGGEFANRKIDANMIKQIVTQEFCTVNEKFVPHYTVRNRSNYLFSSNHADAMRITRDDRRSYIHEVYGPAMSGQWYDRYAAWRAAGGARHLMYRMMHHIDLTNFRPHDAPPMTAAKRNMATLSLSDAGSWIDDLRHSPEQVLIGAGVPPLKARDCDLYTTTQLMRMFNPLAGGKEKGVSMIGFARLLNNNGLRILNQGLPVRTEMGVLKLIAVRNQARWEAAEPLMLREHYEMFNSSGRR